MNGRPERIHIGVFPEVSVDDARTAAQIKAGKIAKGENPQEAKRDARREWTLGELWTWYLEQYAKLHKRESSVLQNEPQWKLHLSHWKTRRLSSIKRSDVSALHARIGGEKGKYAANRTLELIRHMYVKAVENGWAADNPARGIKRFREQPRERFLSADELPRFMAAVAQEEREVGRDFILTALFTGARRSNVASMRWSELDLPAGIWRIPGDKFKNGKPQTVHLSEPVLAILCRRQRLADGSSPFVFPSWGKSGHYREPKYCIRRIMKRAGLTDLRFHDLRRTLGSWQAATGASLPIIGKTLGHSSLTSTQIYARLDIDPVRTAVNVATTAMLAAAKMLPGESVDRSQASA